MMSNEKVDAPTSTSFSFPDEEQKVLKFWQEIDAFKYGFSFNSINIYSIFINIFIIFVL